MAEYIDKEKAIAIADKFGCNNGSCIGKHSGVADVIASLISDLPAAEVSTVRHGKWENGNPICPVCGENKFKDLDADIWCDWQPDFCPNCGAKMDGGDGNSDIA